MKLTYCPSTLAEGYETYSPVALKNLFAGKKVSHILPYDSPEKNEEDNKCSNTGTVSDLWKAEINYIFLLNKHSRLKWGGDYYNNHTNNQMYYAYQSGEGWQKEEHVEAKQYITVYTI